MITTIQIFDAGADLLCSTPKTSEANAGLLTLLESGILESAMKQLRQTNKPMDTLGVILLTCIELGMKIKENEIIKKSHD